MTHKGKSRGLGADSKYNEPAKRAIKEVFIAYLRDPEHSVAGKRKKEGKTTTMATEKERLQALVNAGVATGTDTARLRELILAEATGETLAATPAPLAAPAAPAVKEGETITVSLSNIKKFKEGAEYSLTKEGLFRSKLVHHFEPSTDKPQRWFIFESDDPKVKPVNRGVFVGEYGAGAGILRTLLDALRIKYQLDEATGELTITMPPLPIPCWADWSKDAKGIGGVKISGLKPGDAKVEQAL